MVTQETGKNSEAQKYTLLAKLWENVLLYSADTSTK